MKLNNQWTWEKNTFQRKKYTFTAVTHKHKLHNHTPVCRENARSSYIHIFVTLLCFNPYPTAFPYGNGMVLHFYQQQESSTTKTVHKVINKGLKAYV